jgi:hypothetical protein
MLGRNLPLHSCRKEKGGAKAPPVSLFRLTLLYRPVSACGLNRVRGERTRPVFQVSTPGQGRENPISCQLHPLVAPQVLHFMQVPLRTSV